MMFAIVLNAVGAAVLVGGWTLAVLHAHRALAADERGQAAGPMTGRGQLAPARAVLTRTSGSIRTRAGQASAAGAPGARERSPRPRTGATAR